MSFYTAFHIFQFSHKTAHEPLIEEALERSKTEDDGTINRWLLKAFS